MKYKNVMEITKGFIKAGWNNPTFEEVPGPPFTVTKSYKYFRMLETGNIFDDNGKIAFYNIPALKNPISYPTCR